MRSIHHALVLESVLLEIGTGTAAIAESMSMHDHARTLVQAQRAPSTKAFEEAEISMRKSMGVSYTDHADVDFA